MQASLPIGTIAHAGGSVHPTFQKLTKEIQGAVAEGMEAGRQGPRSSPQRSFRESDGRAEEEERTWSAVAFRHTPSANLLQTN